MRVGIGPSPGIGAQISRLMCICVHMTQGKFSHDAGKPSGDGLYLEAMCSLAIGISAAYTGIS
jgi:hypothetical protein